MLPSRTIPASGVIPPRKRPLAAPPPAPLPANTLVIYTDGSGPEPPATTAGWGFAVVSGGNGRDDDRATELHSRRGPVPTDQSDPSYLGATRGTNNTGELTAIAEALRYLLADQSSRPALIRYDSTYAANMAAGRWRAKSNKRLVASVRKLWTQAHEHLGGRLWASHVDAHTDHRWNDRADELARHGKGGALHARRPRGGSG